MGSVAAMLGLNILKILRFVKEEKDWDFVHSII
jgi:hypothetical protein